MIRYGKNLRSLSSNDSGGASLLRETPRCVAAAEAAADAAETPVVPRSGAACRAD